MLHAGAGLQKVRQREPAGLRMRGPKPRARSPPLAEVPVTHITVVDFGIGYPRACVGKHIAGAATITVH